ncbi:hypothetical protein OCU04_008232 [Sclerotinia nivalis]|uniref:C2H2-type domain-containing protein n=1 Tax=Sclerotinia nivalis TaxID=352851 RepID=A0A9X0DIL3_9HELO|nr:hypothetical protein OCU04_008232 [Sclerotinia nivalis]
MATFRWHMKDDIALLAWIDFCKQEKLEPNENMLNFMVLFYDVPSRDAVKEHLSELWKRYSDQSDDSDQTTELFDMLSKGSAYMTKLPGGMHEGIRTQVDQHISNATSLLITKVMRDNKTQKKSTSQSKAHSLEEENKRGVKRSKQVEKADESPPLSKKARSSKAESSTKVIEEIAANGVEKSRPSVGKPATPSTKTKDGVADSNGKEVIRTKPDVFPTDLINQTTNENNWLKHLKALENKYNREIAHIQELWQAEVEKLSMKEAEAQRTIRDLKAEVKHLIEARKARQDEGRKTQEEDVNVSRETRQFEDLEEIYRLTKENREIHKFATFADLNSPGSLHLGQNTVDDAMDQIQFELSSISYHRNTTGRLFPRIFAISGDLRNLTLSAFSSDIETATGRNDVETIMKKFGAQTCIRVLVLAALRDWVFMSRFPNFTPSNPRILSSYRHIISSLGECPVIGDYVGTNSVDGKDKLYSLDMAAHRTIIEGKWFKEESIPRRAMDLAARFSNAVAPLFAATPDSVEDGSFHTWGEHTECWKDRRAHLQEIFQTALTLKAESVVTKCRYGFALYPAGTTFVGDTSDLKETGRLKNGNNWIHASFHIYDSMIVGNANETALVQTENFVKASGRMDDAKYSKVLLLPKRQSEAASGRIIEVAENSSRKHKSASQSNIEPEAGTPQKPGAPSSTVGSVKANEAAGREDGSKSDQGGDPPLPTCEECGKEFPVAALLRRHKKNRSCTECSECGRRFGRTSALRNHQKAEHSEYRASKLGGQTIEQAHTQPQVSGIVDQKKSRYHEEILAAVASDFSPTHQRNDHNCENQLVEVQRPSSSVAPQIRPAKVCRNKLKQKIPESEFVDAEPRCDFCGKLFSNMDNLRRHNKKSRQIPAHASVRIARQHSDAEERRGHQRSEHKFVERELKDPRTISEPQTPPTSPRKIDKSRSSNHTKTPSSNDARILDKNGKPRYKKTPRKEAEDSDANDILSPSEITKTARAQRRRYTRSSDGAEVRMTGSQESPVRPGARRSKTPVIEE